MNGIHNLYLKKLYSELVETNALKPLNLEITQTAVPTIALEPYINIVKSTSITGTLYTTPTDKDFYLTNVVLTCWADNVTPAQGFATISYTPKGASTAISLTVSTAVNGDNSSNTVSIPFPFRGVLLEKNSAVNCVVGNTLGFAFIAGYTGSDRS